MLTSTNGFIVSKGDHLCSAAGVGQRMLVLHCCFTEPRLLCQLCSREVPCSICDILETSS